MRMAKHPWLALLLAALGAGTASAQAPGQDVYDYFDLNCKSCHTIGGGRLTGPDLKDVGERQDRDWLVEFIQHPKAVIDGGDAYAQAMLRDARGVYMPDPPGLSADLAGRIVDLLVHESAQEESRFAGLQISDRPLTDADIALGRQLFRGETPFANGGPTCFSCHTLAGAGGFGGGQLGPDLTAVYARLEGRKALSAWLSAPPSLVMAPIFRAAPIESEEVLALTAYLKHVAAGGQEQAQDGTLAFLLTGFALAALVLVLFDVIWRDRFVATREPLVRKRRAQEGNHS
ncbi:MAG: hypothetical protein DRQ55_03375 [Planctomycetota bacterium]|nr:MAG: hypothetical protein DRQ55_03375 [Planctomycetota bacterium]